MSRRFRGDRMTNAMRARAVAEYFGPIIAEADKALRVLAAGVEPDGATTVAPPTKSEILRAWAESAESSNWPTAEWAQVCVQFPYLYTVGDGGELFAVIDRAGRVFSEDEFSGELLCHCAWVDLLA